MAQDKDDIQQQGETQPQVEAQPQGAAQPQAEAQPQGAAQPQGKAKKKRGKTILIVALVLVAAFVVMALVGGNSSKPSSEPFDPAKYQEVDYATLAKTPDDYKGQKIYVVGSIAQVIEGKKETDIRLATGASGYDDIVFIKIDNSLLGNNHLRDGQALGVYGTCTGQYHYTSAFGVDISVPGMVADQLNEDAQTPQQKMIAEVQAIFDNVTFEKVSKGYGLYEYTATVTNTTGQDIKNVSIILGLYDDSGTRMDETYASANSWGAGETAVFETTSLKDAAQVKAEVQSFSIGGQYYSAR